MPTDIKALIAAAKQAAAKVEMPKLPPASGSMVPSLSLDKRAFQIKTGSSTIEVGESGALTIIIVKTAPAMARTYYDKAYAPGESVPPACWSYDGVSPAAAVPSPQARACSICPKNMPGSAANGSARACAQSLPMLVYVDDENFTGLVRLRVNATSYWGKVLHDKQVSEGFMSGGQLFGFLQSNQLPPISMMLELRFDKHVEASTNKIVFRPSAPTTAELIDALNDEAKSIDFSRDDAPTPRQITATAQPQVLPAPKPAPQPASYHAEVMQELSAIEAEVAAVEEKPAPAAPAPVEPAPRKAAAPAPVEPAPTTDGMSPTERLRARLAAKKATAS